MTDHVVATTTQQRYPWRAAARTFVQVLIALPAGLLILSGVLPQGLEFPVFFFWAVSVFFMAGVTFGNLNALALQRMGHIAGMAASIVAAISTLAAVLIAAPVGLLYNGTAIPAITATLICSGRIDPASLRRPRCTASS